ncbi:MAG: hypothetical protein FJZ90_10970 [Chloroflexi bacterium]|nr:hypothetical protein [Chloroflexota bacterium]
MTRDGLLGTPLWITLGVGIARLFPRRLGYWISRQGARWMARRRTRAFRVLRNNIAHVVGPQASDAELDAMAESALYLAGRTYVDTFKKSVQEYEREGKPMVRVKPDEWQRTWDAMRDSRGTLIAGVHTSNFDLAMQWIAAHGCEMQTLSLPEPNAGTRMMNALRRRPGLLVTPASPASVRQALDRLRRGGVVVTGVDRPVAESDDRVAFFGHETRLPTGYVRMALQSDARIIVASCRLAEDGCYWIDMAPPLEAERTGDRAADVRRMLERVLAECERFISAAPEQWLVFVPVWEDPDAPPER